MATEEVKSTEEHTTQTPAPAKDDASKDVVVEEKTEVALALVPTAQEKDDLSKDPAVAHTIALAHVGNEKRLSFIKAWEESEKSKVENKAQKKFSAVDSWENSKKAEIEAKLRRLEEELEKKKADYAEKMKNKVALIHKQAEEKRAVVVAMRDEEILKAEEMAAKYRTLGTLPKKPLGCLG